MALSLLNWVLVGLFNDVLDAFYLTSWNVFLACEYMSFQEDKPDNQVSLSSLVYPISRLLSSSTD
jgi:hypothetical protein